MNSIEIAKMVRSDFFTKIKTQIDGIEVNSSHAVISNGKWSLQVDDWYLKANDGFVYGVTLYYPVDTKYHVVEIDSYISINNGRASVGSLLELEHLILRNYGLKEGKIDLDAIEAIETVEIKDNENND